MGDYIVSSSGERPEKFIRELQWSSDPCEDTYKSLYPNITLEHNIASNTLIGKIEIPEKVYMYENINKDPKYQRSGQYIENMVCENYIVFCHRWFHLANFMELLQDMREYYAQYLNTTTNGQIHEFERIENKVYINPITTRPIDPFDRNIKARSPLVIFNKRPEVKRY